MEETNNGESSKGGVIPRSAIYAKTSKFSEEMLEILVYLARHSRQESVRMASAAKVLDKAIPDLKAMEITGEDHGPIRFIISLNEDDRRRVADLKLSQTAVDLRQPGQVQDSGQGSEVRTDQGSG